MGACGEGRARLCLEVRSEGMGGDRHKLPPGKWQADVKGSKALP